MLCYSLLLYEWHFVKCYKWILYRIIIGLGCGLFVSGGMLIYLCGELSVSEIIGNCVIVFLLFVPPLDFVLQDFYLMNIKKIAND